MSTTITGATPHAVDLLRVVDPADTEACAMAQALIDANQSRKAAQQRRDAAANDRIDLMERAADKLRQMGRNSVWSGVLQATAGVAGAALSATTAVLSTTPPEINSGAICQRGSWIPAAQQSLQAATHLDPFRFRNDTLQTEKARVEVRAEVAQQRADHESEVVSEAQRQITATTAQLQRLQETRAAAMAAATHS